MTVFVLHERTYDHFCDQEFTSLMGCYDTFAGATARVPDAEFVEYDEAANGTVAMWGGRDSERPNVCYEIAEVEVQEVRDGC